MYETTDSAHATAMADESDRHTWPGAAIATASPDATLAAAYVLGVGGNAVDAAVAAAWVLAVCEPSASGLGGQAVALVHCGGQTCVFDGHSFAPAALDPDSLSKQQQRSGYAACTIPSMPATLDALHARFGRLNRHTVMKAAIVLADAGYRLSPLQARQIRWTAGALRESGVGDCFLHHGEPLPAGSLIRQPALARTLRRLADAGVRDFYEGDIAARIVADMAARGGLIGAHDLAAFAAPVASEPLSFHYRGQLIRTVAPPGGGLQLGLALKVLEQIDGLDGCDEATWLAAVAFALFAAFLERDSAPLPVEQWPAVSELRNLSPANVSQAIDAALRALGGGGPADPLGASEEAGDTTHLTVADPQGNVVGITLSIQSVFGAKVASPELGFFYNNYLRTCPRTPHPQQLAPGCRPRSNALPAMVFDPTAPDVGPRLSLGSAGSRRIVSSVLQVMSRVLDRGSGLRDAVSAPRIHALLSRKLWIEQPAATPELIERLGAKFAEIIVKPRLCYSMAAVHAVGADRQGRLESAADPRRDGDIYMENGND
jgi:gamma-glutamyltranspeptidase/glutathione hydrolase